jgi:hypothetical protein
MRSGVSGRSAAVPGRDPRRWRRRLSHRPLAGAGQADTCKVCGRILCRAAAGFGEGIVPDAASAWGQGCRGRQGHRFGDSSSAARSFTIKAMN